MLKNEKKNSTAMILLKQIALASAGLLILVLISIPLAKNISRRYQINQEVSDLEKEIFDLENKNTSLSGLITYLESNQFIEEQARLNLGLKKNGEGVAVIKREVSDENQTASSSVISIFNIPGLNNAEPAKKITNPRKWWKYFFN